MAVRGRKIDFTLSSEIEIYRSARAARLVDGASEVHAMVPARFLREEGRDFWHWSAGNRV